MSNSPNDVGLYPDTGVTHWIFGVCVCLTAFSVRTIAVLFNCLIHCHVIGQNMISNQELQTVTGLPLANKYSSLQR